MELRIVAVMLGGAMVIASTGCATGVDYGDAPVRKIAKSDSGTPTADSGAPDTGSEDTGMGEDTAPEEDTATPDTGGTEDTSPTDSGLDPCTDCVNKSCKGELSACYSDTTCKAQMDCISKCGDPTCADKCVTDFPSTKMDLLLDCVSTKCRVECSGP